VAAGYGVSGPNRQAQEPQPQPAATAEAARLQAALEARDREAGRLREEVEELRAELSKSKADGVLAAASADAAAAVSAPRLENDAASEASRRRVEELEVEVQRLNGAAADVEESRRLKVKELEEQVMKLQLAMAEAKEDSLRKTAELDAEVTKLQRAMADEKEANEVALSGASECSGTASADLEALRGQLSEKEAALEELQSLRSRLVEKEAAVEAMERQVASLQEEAERARAEAAAKEEACSEGAASATSQAAQLQEELKVEQASAKEQLAGAMEQVSSLKDELDRCQRSAAEHEGAATAALEVAREEGRVLAARLEESRRAHEEELAEAKRKHAAELTLCTVNPEGKSAADSGGEDVAASMRAAPAQTTVGAVEAEAGALELVADADESPTEVPVPMEESLAVDSGGVEAAEAVDPKAEGAPDEGEVF